MAAGILATVNPADEEEVMMISKTRGSAGARIWGTDT